MADSQPAEQPGSDPATPEAGAPEAQTPEVGTPEGEAAELPALRERVAQLEDLWLRSRADLDNLRKRSGRELGAARTDERNRVSVEWLPVLDALDLAFDHAQSDPGSVMAGVAAVRDLALVVMDRLGYPRHDAVGESFDPSRHEAVATVPDDAAVPGTVVRVMRPGYGDDSRQLRPAAVVVARGEE